MKLLSRQESLMAISGGVNNQNLTNYKLMTQVGASVGGIGFFTSGAYVAISHRSPHLFAVLIVPLTCALVGTIGGYLAGAVTHTFGNHFGKIVGKTFEGIDYIFAPAVSA